MYFPYLIIKLCKLVKVPIISRVNNKVKVTNRNDMKKTMDGSKSEFRVNKLPLF